MEPTSTEAREVEATRHYDRGVANDGVPRPELPEFVGTPAERSAIRRQPARVPAARADAAVGMREHNDLAGAGAAGAAYEPDDGDESRSRQNGRFEF